MEYAPISPSIHKCFGTVSCLFTMFKMFWNGGVCTYVTNHHQFKNVLVLSAFCLQCSKRFEMETMQMESGNKMFPCFKYVEYVPISPSIQKRFSTVSCVLQIFMMKYCEIPQYKYRQLLCNIIIWNLKLRATTFFTGPYYWNLHSYKWLQNVLTHNYTML